MTWLVADISASDSSPSDKENTSTRDFIFFPYETEKLQENHIYVNFQMASH